MQIFFSKMFSRLNKLQKEVSVFCSNSTSGNFRDSSKGQKSIKKLGVIGFNYIKKFYVLSSMWLIIAILFCVEIVFCVCGPKNWLKLK